MQPPQIPSHVSHPSQRAVCLLSGGLDSATCLAWARAQGLEVGALTLRYGQRHGFELKAAATQARLSGAFEHRVIEVDLASLAPSPLTGHGDVPKKELTPERFNQQIQASAAATYVPARNLIFLSLALGYAESIGARQILIGANAVDYSGYPDCRPDFIEAFERLAQLATAASTFEGARFLVRAPLLAFSKAEIVKLACSLGVALEHTHSCYDPLVDGRGGALACGRCDACQLRLKGFETAGVIDPLPYASKQPALRRP